MAGNDEKNLPKIIPYYVGLLLENNRIRYKKFKCKASTIICPL